MVYINRKQIDNYYEKEWADVVSKKTLDLLVELTCKAYHLNLPLAPGYISEKELIERQDLGKI
jgi:hypothetical protein